MCICLIICANVSPVTFASEKIYPLKLTQTLHTFHPNILNNVHRVQPLITSKCAKRMTISQ